ncbi:MAG: hemolysin family protein [Cumulibacter sp.]
MSAVVVIPVTVALIVLSALFVATEFALLAAKPHRLQDRAANSRSARAALRSNNELTLLLAGSQLGITACALALGAITKPAVMHALTPLIMSIGAPLVVAEVASFILALLVVTFLHLVIGEMAPKSWAIAHPETAATVLALPMRGFMFLTRPALIALNSTANWLLRKVGVQPQPNVSTGQSADDLRHLVEHSASVGALDETYSAQLTIALDLQNLSVGDLLDPNQRINSVDASESVLRVRQQTRASGHLRIPVTKDGVIVGVVHVRDTLMEPDDRAASEIMRPIMRMTASTPVHSALATMRETRTHLVLVESADGPAGIVTLADVLKRLFPGRQVRPA